MDPERTWKLVQWVRANPESGTVAVFIAGLILIVGMWLTGYLGERGRQAASPPVVASNAPRTAERVVAIEEPLTEGGTRGDWRLHTFDLVRDKGAVLQLGRCPGPECLFFRLDEISTEGETVVQEFTLGGDGLGVFLNPGGNPFLQVRNLIRLGGGSIRTSIRTVERRGWIALDTGSRVDVCSEQYDLRLRILSVEAQKLRLQLSVKPGTWNEGPPDQKCTWIKSTDAP
jgi:hypothetical protein